MQLMLANTFMEVNTKSLMHKPAHSSPRQDFRDRHQQFVRRVGNDEICARDFWRLKTKLKERQAWKELIDRIGDPPFVVSAVAVANNGEIKFFVPGNSVSSRRICQRAHLMSFLLDDELARRTQNLCGSNRENPSH